MDADDFSVANRFELQINKFKQYNVDIIGGQIDEYDESLRFYLNTRKVPLNNPSIKKTIKYRNNINNVTVMIKKKTFESLGGFPDLYFGEDYILWLLAIEKNYQIINLEETLVIVRTNQDFVNKRLGLIIL